MDFRKLPFPSHLGKYFIKIGKISAKIHEIGKIKAIFGLGMTPILGRKNGQIKSLIRKEFLTNINSHAMFEENQSKMPCIESASGAIILYLFENTHLQSQTTPSQYQLLYKV